MDDYSLREGQLLMAEAVATAIEEKQDLIVEAGTGVGKTLAYLLPALKSGERVLISTATHALQSQLIDKDVPLAMKLLDLVVPVGQLKGFRSYVCRLAVECALVAVPDDSRKRLQRVVSWMRETVTGDLAELGIDQQDQLSTYITTAHEGCSGSECPHFSSCFVMRARKRVSQYQVVVVNHHLLLSDMRMVQEGTDGLLPAFAVRIIDEAHDWADVAWQVLVDHCSDSALGRLFQRGLWQVRGSKGGCLSVKSHLVRCQQLLANLREVFTRALSMTSRDTPSHAIFSALKQLATHVALVVDEWRLMAPHDSHVRELCRSLTVQFRRLRRFLEARCTGEFGWINGSQGTFSIHVAPADIAKSLEAAYKVHPGVWVATSATLAVDHSLRFFKSITGWYSATELMVDSPFDFRSNAKGWVSTDAPNAGTLSHIQWMSSQIQWIGERINGGVLVLMTSIERSRRLGAMLRESGFNRPVGVQGESNSYQLLSLFKASGRAVLIGTRTFWRGVDVQGDALSVVVIEKLPFPNPADPLSQAYEAVAEARGERAFDVFYLPRAILALKQGIGRLIRSEHDHGWIVVADSRWYTKSYGEHFSKNLPPIEWVDDRGALVADQCETTEC